MPIPAHYRPIAVLILLLSLFCARPAAAYSVLTHEELIDLTWSDSIVPLLLSRYPNLTPAQLEEARAYAYGGCVIQDIGYYPFGDKQFSDLTHYVRSGDFVVNLFRNATNADELAFATGALSHYIGDSIGHAQAVNLAVPIEFPSLRAKYGPVVNYAEGEHQHVQTEFAFDIDQIAHHRLAPVHYLRHVGLQVPIRQLALAFYQTYGLTEDFSAARGRRVNVHAYRFAVRAFIPRIAYAVNLLHRNHEPTDPSTPEIAALDQKIKEISAASDWDSFRRKPGIGTYTLAGLIFVIPKFGPLTLVAVKGPTADTEAEYLHTVSLSAATLRTTLARFTPPSTPVKSDAGSTNAPPRIVPVSSELKANPSLPVQSSDPRHPLPNRDLDTGNVVKPGGYSLTDSTFAALLHQLTRKPTQPIPPGIKESIQSYYADPNAPITTRKDPAKWAEVQADLVTLNTMPTSTEPEPFQTYGDQASEVSQ